MLRICWRSMWRPLWRAMYLLLGLHHLDSVRGIQQGDPLGPLLFVIAIQEVVQKAKVDVLQQFLGELDFVTFYLDDRFGGSSRAVRLFCTLLAKGLNDVGLTLQQDKCEIIPSATEGHGVSSDAFADFNFNSTGNFKLLGASFW